MADKYTYSATARTPVVRAAFFRGVEPEVRTNDKGVTEKTWGFTAIAPAGSDLTGVKAAIVDAATKMWGSTAGDKLKHPKFKSPLKDGATQVDKDGKLYAGFEAGQTTFKLSTKSRKPGLVDRKVRAIIDEQGTTLVDKANGLHEIVAENEVYSGCWFLATFSAMAYDRDDGFGVSLKLENLQLVKQDERLGGGGAPAAEDQFGALADAGGDDLADLLS